MIKRNAEPYAVGNTASQTPEYTAGGNVPSQAAESAAPGDVPSQTTEHTAIGNITSQAAEPSAAPGDISSQITEKPAAGDVPFHMLAAAQKQKKPSVNMNQIVGSQDILLICLDTLRYDAAIQEESAGTTPVLNQYGPWEKRQAPGNFTWPSHHSMFSGFLPAPFDAKHIADQELLFFPKGIGLGKKGPESAYCFSGSTVMDGLAQEGYDTWCVGGVAFFDKRSDMGKVFPGYFQKSYWNPSFGCPVKDSTRNQVDFILKKLAPADPQKRIFLYLNVDAIHYPNYFYLDGAEHDSLDSHKAALRYVDGELGRLFDEWKNMRGGAFVICCSDHGTCYGEDGCHFHGINHPVVNTVPYKHFFL